MATLREEIEQHLRDLNMAWKLWDYLELDLPPSNSATQDSVDRRFTAARTWLEDHGVNWFDFPYDRRTKTFSLPDDH